MTKATSAKVHHVCVPGICCCSSLNAALGSIRRCVLTFDFFDMSRQAVEENESRGRPLNDLKHPVDWQTQDAISRLSVTPLGDIQADDGKASAVAELKNDIGA